MIGGVISWLSTPPAGRGRTGVGRPGDGRRGFREGGGDAPDRRGGGDGGGGAKVCNFRYFER